MSAVADIASTFSASAAAPKSVAQSSQETQDRFLKLLVTQMKNQDPLNPLDNAQVTTQLAQINTVSGLDKLNTTLQGVASNLSASQTLQAASLIGRGVLSPGNALSLQNGAAAFGVELPQAADVVTVTVRDLFGNVVHSEKLGAQAAGVVALQWDGANNQGGTAADGTYLFSVEAVAGGAKMDASTLSFARIESVANNRQGVVVNLGNRGSVGINDIRQII